MKKKIRNIVALILIGCLMVANMETVALYASEASLEETKEVSAGSIIQEAADDSTENLDSENITEAGNEKIIMSFEGFVAGTENVEISVKPSQEELTTSFPQTLTANMEDGNTIEFAVQWSTTEDYEAEWTEIIFTANIKETYQLAEGVTLPVICVFLTEPSNDGVMAIEAEPLVGSGTAEDPFLIYKVEDFSYVREHNDEGIYYKLMSDIDLAAVEWEPLGKSNSDPFGGYFDGNGYRIYNLNKISYAYTNYGIFGYLKNATVCNLEIAVMDGVQIQSPNTRGYNSGGLLCRYGNNSTIYNCSVFGDYIAVGYSECAGLIAAEFYGGSISNCMVQGYVRADGNGTFGWDTVCYTGGLVGKSTSTITDCISFATVLARTSTSGGHAGGICAGGNAAIHNCLFLGETLNSKGRIVGQIYGSTEATTATVTDSYYVSENSADVKKEKFGEGKSISELRQQATFIGWNFENIWTMDDPNNAGFPMLRSMLGVEHPVSQYILPTIVRYSEGTGQTLLSNDMALKVYFDRNIAVEQNDGVYFEELSSRTKIKCSYSAINGNELQITTKEKLLNGKKYKLVITNQCVKDAAYSNNYSIGADGEFEVSVCKPEFAGDGSKENPYIVSTIEQLNCVYYQPAKNYVLSNDIDASTVKSINSIGGCKQTDFSGSVVDSETYGEKAAFTGTFDGQGHTISGIKEFSGQCILGNAYSHYIGLFSWTQGATIKNLTVSMADDCYKYNERQGTIVDVHGYTYVAILVATGSGTILNCTVQGEVYSDQETTAAGLLAGSFNGEIENCVAFGAVSNKYNDSGSYVGGLVGITGTSNQIRNSYAIATVTASPKVAAGGLVGNNRGTIQKTYAAGGVSQVDKSGGLVGVNTGAVADSFFDTTLSGKIDSDKGIPKQSSEMKLMETYLNWDFINCWAINNKNNGGYPFLIGNEGAQAISASPTIITVLDGVDGTTEIQNPVIKLLDDNGEIITQYQGDEGGVITMPDIILDQTYNIEIVVDGYGPYLNENFKLKAFATHIVMLYPQTDTPVVYCANLVMNDAPSNYIDVLQKSKVLSQERNDKFSLSVAATYKDGIKDVCLTQSGDIKMRSKTGIFENLDARCFDCDKCISILVTGKDGSKSELYRTYLNVSSVSVKDQGFSGSLGSGKLEINVPSDVPFLGDAKISISDVLKNVKMFQVGTPSEGKIRYSINLQASEEIDHHDGRPMYDEMKEILEYSLQIKSQG